MQNMRALTLSLAAVLALLGTAARGGIVTEPGVPPYTATLVELPPLPGHTGSVAFGLNNKGQAVGLSFLVDEFDEIIEERAVIWNGGRVRALPLFPGTTDSRANTVDELGRAGGRVGRNDPFGFRGALWVGNQVRLLPAIGPGDFTTVEDINPQGIAVGHSNDANGTDQAVYWVNGRPTFLPPLIGNVGASALAINFRQQIVGVSFDADDFTLPVLWQNNRVAALPLPLDATEGAANDINDRNVIAGEAYSEVLDTVSAVVWRNRVVEPLPVPDSAVESAAFSVNNQGAVVGGILELVKGEESEEFTELPVLWDGPNVVNLNVLIPPGSGWEELVIPDQSDVLNDQVQVVGVGLRNGLERAFRMAIRRVR